MLLIFIILICVCRIGTRSFVADIKNLRINEQIRIREVRVSDGDGVQLGIMPTQEALQRARDAGLDLVEIVPHAKPPVCKIVDYGKYRFQMEKKLRDTKKNQKQQLLKEVKMFPKIAVHDLEVKAKAARGFLEAGDKVKITIKFKGRELAHTEIGYDVMQDIVSRIGTEELYTVEKKATMEGRNMSMTLAPKAKKQ